MASSVVYISLGHDLNAIVDDCDAESVSHYRWHRVPRHREPGDWYARTHLSSTRLIYLHRFILSVPDGLQIDHIDGNGLNCTRANMRFATQSQNMANRGPQRNNTSGFRGVSWDKKSRVWYASVRHMGRTKNIGRFESAEEAARAVDAYLIEVFGPFAKLNFPKHNVT